ncbi:RNA polymerase II subunit A C-terminal domain phosphatase [Aphelenchoides fujianensis]|nr:RNA polymerase II subunit A C-terminal domain phosphatase [Aphelenchoides fujianensis]
MSDAEAASVLLVAGGLLLQWTTAAVVGCTKNRAMDRRKALQEREARGSKLQPPKLPSARELPVKKEEESCGLPDAPAAKPNPKTQTTERSIFLSEPAKSEGEESEEFEDRPERGERPEKPHLRRSSRPHHSDRRSSDRERTREGGEKRRSSREHPERPRSSHRPSSRGSHSGSLRVEKTQSERSTRRPGDGHSHSRRSSSHRRSQSIREERTQSDRSIKGGNPQHSIPPIVPLISADKSKLHVNADVPERSSRSSKQKEEDLKEIRRKISARISSTPTDGVKKERKVEHCVTRKSRTLEEEVEHHTTSAKNSPTAYPKSRNHSLRKAPDRSASGRSPRFKSPARGLVRLNGELAAGAALEQGRAVAWITGPCNHPQVMIDTCAVCGANLVGTAFMEEKRRGTAPYVSTVHNAPGLMTNLNIATELDRTKKEALLAARRLILLIDLDLTLVHTTNRAPRPDEMRQALGFRLHSTHYWTRVRPHTAAFLERVHRLFECHVVTYGERVYAQKIVELLDPQGRFFHSRILTRNELISMAHKSVNLSALFPSGVETVLMIDDRPDVWEHSDALVWVRPYRFFREVDDINAPRESEEKPEKEAVEEAGEQADEQELGDTPENPAEPPAAVEQPDGDADDVLVRVEWALTTIHARYFEAYERDQQLLDVKTVAAGLRSEVLRDEVLVLSGVVQLQQNLQEHPFYRECVRLGARVAAEVDERTTALIAAKPHTEKYRAARKRRLPIVTPAWLHECSARWENVEKEPFLLRPSLAAELEPGTSSELSILPRPDLRSMEDEVAAALAALSDEEEDDEEQAQAVEDEEEPAVPPLAMHHRFGGRRHEIRVHEKDVPKSRHSIFFRGLPPDMPPEKVKDFFAEEVGPCSIDFHKTSAAGFAFLALRFVSRRDARKCMEQFHNALVFGHKVDLSWYRDIRRYVNHLQRSGQERHRSHHRRSRSRSRSRHRSRSSSARRSERDGSESRDGERGAAAVGEPLGRAFGESARPSLRPPTRLQPPGSPPSRRHSPSTPRGPRTPPEPHEDERSAGSGDDEPLARAEPRSATPRSIRVRITSKLPEPKPEIVSPPSNGSHSVDQNLSASSESSVRPPLSVEPPAVPPPAPLVLQQPPPVVVQPPVQKSEAALFCEYLVSLMEKLPSERRLRLQIQFQQSIIEAMCEQAKFTSH